MLQLTDIRKEYRTGELVQKALDGVSFSLRDCEFVSVLGPSGSGKTTLLNIIGGLDRYDSGELKINGISTKEYKSRDWDTYRNHTIGFVFQSYNLIPHQSVLANVELALTIGGVSSAERKERAKEALRKVGLEEHIYKKPNQLSGGQMQRVSIARALVNDPDIVLADEPTGALDSETSVQIMDILKKISETKLVVMVTHNEELAVQYSTRIIKLKDGKIISDSMPATESAGQTEASQAEKQITDEKTEASQAEKQITGEKAEASQAEKRSAADKAKPAQIKANKASKKAKKAHMSFATSLLLSFTNLKSKLGRTILISLACSIGIIGIALILSISTGVNDYIYQIQKDTMSSYPLTISAETIDLTSLFSEGSSIMSELKEAMSDLDADTVKTDYSVLETDQMYSSSFAENDLTAFKKYLDDPDCEINDYLGENGIVYTYDVSFDVYTIDADGHILDTNSDTPDSSDYYTDEVEYSGMGSSLMSMRNSFISMGLGRSLSGAQNFTEMTAGGSGQAVSQIIKDNYDLVYGSWPESYDEVVVVLSHNSLTAEELYQLGVMSAEEYKEAARAVENGEEAPEFNWEYEDICNIELYLLTASDHYVLSEDGTYTYLDAVVENQEQLLERAVRLKVTGIIRPAEDATEATLNTAVAYTSMLTDYCISHADESDVVKAQEEDQKTNVLTGLAFAPDSDAEKAEAVKEYIGTLGITEKAELYNLIAFYGGVDDTETSESLSDIMDTFGLGESMSEMTVFLSLLGLDEETLLEGFSSIIGDESQQAAKLDNWMENDPDEKIMVILYEQYLAGSTYDDNMQAFGKVNKDAPISINIYTDTFEDKDMVTEAIAKYNALSDSDTKIVYTDYIALITSSITTIIDAISYVLIAFVAVSLIVSCIMIGIITHISVLERTKEIGILRALGASKRNISQVFNAETVIIGLFSGVIGILLSLILILPINLILKLLIGSAMVTVNLPPLYAIILIAISVAVTVIGGIIPANKAAKKDPVIALRTE